MWAIIGTRGYVTDEGEAGMMGFYVRFRSANGLSQGRRSVLAAGGIIRQESEDELAGAFPEGSIGPMLRVIRVERLRPGPAHPQGFAKARDAAPSIDLTAQQGHGRTPPVP